MIEFHNNLTVITGANGSGKTTILNLLSKCFGWSFQFIRLPKTDGSGNISYIDAFWEVSDHDKYKSPTITDQNDRDSVGSITFMNGGTQPITIGKGNSPTFSISLRSSSAVDGVHIPSHRPVPTYSNINNIPTEVEGRSTAFENYKNALLRRIIHGNTSQNPGHHIKQTLISWATLGFGNSVVSENPEAIRLFEDFQNVLRKVLPSELGFQGIEIRLPEVVLITDSGDFPLDSVSGGISSIIGIVWQIFMFESSRNRFVVTLDEPENHLHPRLQRSFLPNLRDAFPNVQFIIATHSPLVVGSSKDSNIYVLQFGSSDKVKSVRLNEASRSGTSDEILRDVLGVPSTMPIWASDSLEKIIDEYSHRELDEEAIEQLKSDLKEEGLENEVTRAINEILN